MGFPPVPEEIAGLTGPPPGAPPSINLGGGAPGGPPPELMAALAGGGPGGPPAPAPPGPPPEAPPEESRNPSDILGEVRELLLEYLAAEQDDIDKKTGAALLKGVQDLFAKQQQEEEAASGTTPAIRGMGKALAAGG